MLINIAEFTAVSVFFNIYSDALSAFMLCGCVVWQGLAGQVSRAVSSGLVFISPCHCRPRRTDICSVAATRGRLLCVIDEAAGKYYEKCVSDIVAGTTVPQPCLVLTQ